jgi:hypothetical protein
MQVSHGHRQMKMPQLQVCDDSCGETDGKSRVFGPIPTNDSSTSVTLLLQQTFVCRHLCPGAPSRLMFLHQKAADVLFLRAVLWTEDAFLCLCVCTACTTVPSSHSVILTLFANWVSSPFRAYRQSGSTSADSCDSGSGTNY